MRGKVRAKQSKYTVGGSALLIFLFFFTFAIVKAFRSEGIESSARPPVDEVYH